MQNETAEKKEVTVKKASERVKLLSERGFYGSITLHFKDGMIYHAVEEKSFKFD